MIVLVQAQVVSVGFAERAGALMELPLQLNNFESGLQAARYLKNELVDTVVCPWDLPDMPGGIFVRRLRMAKPNVKVVVLVKSGDMSQELAARSLGVSAVLSDKVSDEQLQEVISKLLSLTSTAAVDYQDRRVM